MSNRAKTKPAGLQCRFCGRVHSRTLMCDTARRVLDALADRGMQFNMPTIEFPEPIRGDGVLPGIGGPGDAYMAQLVVQAAYIETTPGAYVGALIFTGRDANGDPLPRWIYPGMDDELDRAVRLVTDVADMAKRGAEKARGEGKGD